MAFVIADRVQETTTTSGTGAIALNGTSPGYQTFVSGVGSGNNTYYSVYDRTSGIWEVGYGVVTAGSPNTISRVTVIANSSGTTTPVNLVGNSATVFCTYPAEKAVNLDVNGNVSALGTVQSAVWNAAPIGPIYGGTGLTTYNAGDMVVASAANTLTTLPIGPANYVLTSNGVTATWTVAQTASASGVNTQVQYNSGGSFAAAANFTYTGNDVNIPFGPSNSATSAAKVALALSMIA